MRITNGDLPIAVHLAAPTAASSTASGPRPPTSCHSHNVLSFALRNSASVNSTRQGSPKATIPPDVIVEYVPILAASDGKALAEYTRAEYCEPNPSPLPAP